MVKEKQSYRGFAYPGSFYPNPLPIKEVTSLNSKIIPKFLGKGKDISKQRFGRLIAIEPIAERKRAHIVWECLCDCGEKCFISSYRLRNGETRSCGCLYDEHNTTHGKSKTRIYKAWAHMIQRCENPNHPQFKHWGGRGIKVCQRWRESFEAFYEDVGDIPKNKSLDRYPNNDGNYEPNNFRWATKKEQVVNSRPASCGPHKQCWFYGYSSQGHMILENSQNHVARIFELEQACISRCLHGRQKTQKGWTFQWLT